MNYYDAEKHCNPCKHFSEHLVDDNEYRICECRCKDTNKCLDVQHVDSVRDGSDPVRIPKDCPEGRWKP